MHDIVSRDPARSQDKARTDRRTGRIQAGVARKNNGEAGPLEELARGFRKRTWVTMRMMSRMGLQMARRNRGAADLVNDVDEEDAVAAATALLEQLDGLKGLTMKLGQMASYLDGTMPPKAQRILARLQSQSRPMAPATIAEVVRAELGGAPTEVFDEFEPEPFAAASIGQVHRARAGGRALAVKIQYPGIDELLRADVTTIGRLARLALLISPVDGRALVEELAERVLEECDYGREAENQRLMRRALAGRDDIEVPAVCAELSSRRVLSTELCDRLGFQAFVDAGEQAARDAAGARIYEACFASIFHHCTYNADPHPGNYLFSPTGEVTLLDFGCVKRFDPEFIDRWKRLALTLVDGDRAGFRDAFVAVGLVGRVKRFDFDHQWEAMRYLYRPMYAPEPFMFTHAFVAEVNDRLMFRNVNKLRFAMPGDWLFVNRLQLGLLSVLAHLQLTIPSRELFRAALEAPTAPLWRATG